MRSSLHLRFEEGRSWHRHEGCHAKGFAFRDRDHACLQGAALARYLHGPVDQFSEKIRGLNGEFAAILTNATQTAGAAAVDRIRSIPLFYAQAEDTLYLSDDPEWIACQLGQQGRPQKPSARHIAEFLLCGMITGRHTLAADVHQLQAGELLQFHHNIETERYYRFGTSPPPSTSPTERRTERIEKGTAAFRAAFQRFLQSVGDRPLVVPLSGGLDSRLIAALLAEADRTDTLCFSYGRRDSFDARTSRRIAEMLGLRWTFVPYTNRQWHHWYQLESYQRYRREAARLSAIEHEQDWPAVYEMQRTGRLPDDAVFVPGHTGDFLSGSHLPAAAFSEEIPQPVQWIWGKHYVYWPTRSISDSTRQTLTRRIRDVLPHLSSQDAIDRSLAAQVFQQFDWQERQAKMIVNSVRVYEHHGYDWRIPLWDADLMHFWEQVPLADLHHTRLYRDVMRRLLGERLYNVPFNPPRVSFFTEKLRRLQSYNYRFYGAYLGAYPLFASLTTRLRDVIRLEHPTLQALTDSWRHWPLQRASTNALLALFTLQDAYERLQAFSTDDSAPQR